MSTHMPANDQTNTAITGKQLAFLVGQDREGHWLAVETHGYGGGIFRSRDTAVHYARDECHRRPGAVQFADQPISLLIS